MSAEIIQFIPRPKREDPTADLVSAAFHNCIYHIGTGGLDPLGDLDQGSADLGDVVTAEPPKDRE